MKLMIDIDDNVFTRLFNNGVDTSPEDRKVIDRAVLNGKPYEDRSQSEWPPVGEGLPERYKEVIVTDTETGLSKRDYRTGGRQ